jgi:hypothetical protein
MFTPSGGEKGERERRVERGRGLVLLSTPLIKIEGD